MCETMMSVMSFAENLCANTAKQQNSSGQWHADKEFYLMMQDPAIIQNSHGSDQSCARENSFDLGARWAAKHQEHAKNHACVHCQSTKQRDRLQVNFARSRKIDHANSQGQ